MRKITIVGPDKKMALVEELVKAIFRQLLIDIGIENVPSNSTISGKYSCVQHKNPDDWVFSDKHGRDATEARRRINVAKRFLSLFYKGR